MTTIAIKTTRSFEDYKRSNIYGSRSTRSVVRPQSLSYVNATKSSRSTPSSRRRSAKRTKAVAVIVLSVITLFLVLFPAAEAFGGKTLVSSERQGAVDAEQTIVVVEPGDTLWSIAKELEPNKDPRIVVDQLTKSRGTSNVYAGEKIIWSN